MKRLQGKKQSKSSPVKTGSIQVFKPIPRLPNGQFPPGVSGNPAGPPIGHKKFTTEIRELLESTGKGNKFSYKEALKKKILELAIIDGSENIIKLIWNYLDGMPQQDVGILPGGREFGEPDPETKALIEKRFNMNIKR